MTARQGSDTRNLIHTDTEGRRSPDALRQVVDNLLANVGRHTPPGSTATISVRSDIDVAVGTITDDGPGMMSADRHRAFDRCWRADAARARPGGSGLGLAIVHGLVDANHGQIRLDATARGGLLTEIRLPRAPNTHYSPHAAAAP